ncbi:unnamed protein product [Trichobilharzia szidati]|nr:unnamed protein product [Trichobilharzia szidati]
MIPRIKICREDKTEIVDEFMKLLENIKTLCNKMEVEFVKKVSAYLEKDGLGEKLQDVAKIALNRVVNCLSQYDE